MADRKGCEEHPIFQPGCFQCAYDFAIRLQTFIEVEYRNQKATKRFKRDALKVLRGD